MSRAALLLSIVLLQVPSPPAPAASQDGFAARLIDAKALYDAAEYDRALALIDQVEAAAMTEVQSRDRAIYRALCLLALNRQPEAEAAMESVIHAEPLFLVDADAPPRLRALIDGVREKLKPAIVQEYYRRAKERFDAADYPAARAGFSTVLELTADPAHREFADIRLLAAGFRDLSSRALEATPAPSPAPPADVPRPSESPVVPPVVLRQEVPPWPRALRPLPSSDALRGEFEIVIDSAGDVASVKVVRGIHPLYDGLVMIEARRWKYRPATQGGQPIPFVKRLTVNVKPD